MPKKGFTGAIGLRCSAELTDTLKDIESGHRIPAVELTRGLLEAAATFYREHGFFSFPVRIEPEAFQQGYIERVAEPGANSTAKVLVSEARRILREKQQEQETVYPTGRRARAERGRKTAAPT